MKTTFHSDNGARCYQCSGTIYTYHCDDAVSLVDSVCISCGARNLFTAKQTPMTPAQASAAHREAITPGVRDVALAKAKENFVAMSRALFAFWQGRGQEPNEADFGYHHGWFLIDGFSFGPHDYCEGAEQPIMD